MSEEINGFNGYDMSAISGDIHTFSDEPGPDGHDTPTHTQLTAEEIKELGINSLIDLSLADENTPIDEFGNTPLPSPTLRVYLSGGNHSDWRGYVKRYLKHEDIEIVDPYEGKQGPNYAFDNLNKIIDCDAVLGYKEASNPGIGLTTEVAYAAGYGLATVLVIESTANKERRYFGTLEAAVDSVFEELDTGLDAINELAALKRRCALS